jgi:hypothetical protein
MTLLTIGFIHNWGCKMITIKPQYELTRKMRELIEFFNNLEKELEYPNCDGEADKKRTLLCAERQLILEGKL